MSPTNSNTSDPLIKKKSVGDNTPWITVTEVKEKLIEDEDVGFKSFKIIELLGQGTFGKVFKVQKIGTDDIYAMKVLKKSVLVKNKHLKYAITEANVLKRSDHPYIIKMHYSF